MVHHEGHLNQARVNNRFGEIDAGLSKEARQRLKWFDFYEAHGRNTRLTCRCLGISPQTFYRWRGRYDPRHLSSLEARSHKPRHIRHPAWTDQEVKAVLELRQFEALFETECQKRGMRLFALPPWPKLNGGVEWAHRTHTEEFYEVTDK